MCDLFLSRTKQSSLELVNKAKELSKYELLKKYQPSSLIFGIFEKRFKDMDFRESITIITII